jgi:hypothetical protein
MFAARFNSTGAGGNLELHHRLYFFRHKSRRLTAELAEHAKNIFLCGLGGLGR